MSGVDDISLTELAWLLGLVCLLAYALARARVAAGMRELDIDDIGAHEINRRNVRSVLEAIVGFGSSPGNVARAHHLLEWYRVGRSMLAASFLLVIAGIMLSTVAR